MALITFKSSRRRMKSFQCYHSPRLKGSLWSRSSRQDTESFGFHFITVVVNTALIYCLLGLIGVAGQDDSAAVLQHQSESEPINLKLLEQVETYFLIPAMDVPLLISVKDEELLPDQEDTSNTVNNHELNYTFKESATRTDSNHFPSSSDSKSNGSNSASAFRVIEDGDDETISTNHQGTSKTVSSMESRSDSNSVTDAMNKSTAIVPKSFLNDDSVSAIIKNDANSSALSKDNEVAAKAEEQQQDRELITLNNATTNEIPETISAKLHSIGKSNRTEWANETTFFSSTTESSLLFYESESANVLLHSDNEKLHEIELIKSVPISASFASSIKSRRPKRSVVHLYDMVVCSTGCNPLAYKGYGCYCGFLGSGLIVDGIDKCCAKHDWCYHHAKCPPLLTYFVPYYWTCNDGRPKCVNDYRGWKGICGAHLCECDRQFAECLRKYPCPRGRAVCLSSPFRNPVSNYQYNYDYIEDPEIHYYYS